MTGQANGCADEAEGVSGVGDSESGSIVAACRVLAAGGLVAYPTEAVYGLGCDPANAAAVERLLALKQRSPAKGLILIAADSRQLAPWMAPLSADLRERIEATWPGPVTWLVPAAADCPGLIRGAHDSVAVRVTAHPLAAELCRRWGGALVSTSANVAGASPARSAAEARRLFGRAVEVVLDGATGGRKQPTAIRDARTGRTIRH